MNVIIFARENNPRYNTEVEQLNVCRAFAKREEMEVIDEITDINLLLGTRKKYDAVLVTEHSRLSRNRSDYVFIKRLLEARGVEIITAKQNEKPQSGQNVNTQHGKYKFRGVEK